MATVRGRDVPVVSMHSTVPARNLLAAGGADPDRIRTARQPLQGRGACLTHTKWQAAKSEVMASVDVGGETESYRLARETVAHV